MAPRYDIQSQSNSRNTFPRQWEASSKTPHGPSYQKCVAVPDGVGHTPDNRPNRSYESASLCIYAETGETAPCSLIASGFALTF